MLPAVPSSTASESTATTPSDAHAGSAAQRLNRVIPIGIVLFVVCISWHSLWSTRIDDLDSAHHLMNGVYIHDVIRDGALLDIRPYTLHYFQQYPALAFHIYPPVFPIVEGVVFLTTGSIDIRYARACVLGFGVLLAVLFYRELRRNLAAWPALLGVGLFLTTSIVALLYKQLMLEVPTLASMLRQLTPLSNRVLLAWTE